MTPDAVEALFRLHQGELYADPNLLMVHRTRVLLAGAIALLENLRNTFSDCAAELERYRKGKGLSPAALEALARLKGAPPPPPNDPLTALLSFFTDLDELARPLVPALRLADLAKRLGHRIADRARIGWDLGKAYSNFLRETPFP